MGEIPQFNPETVNTQETQKESLQELGRKRMGLEEMMLFVDQAFTRINKSGTGGSHSESGHH